jgi:hypothetical protein
VLTGAGRRHCRDRDECARRVLQPRLVILGGQRDGEIVRVEPELEAGVGACDVGRGVGARSAARADPVVQVG